MTFVLSVAITIVFDCVGASAQLDINPADWSRPNVMVEGMRAQSRTSNARTRGQSSAQRAAQTCAELPMYRSRLGAGSPRVQQLTRLCRQAGY